MAKRSKKTRASASRAKGAKKGATKGAKKSVVKRTKKPVGSKSMTTGGLKGLLPSGFDLKKLRDDIATAQEALTRHLPKTDPQKQRLETTRMALDRWSVDISSMCGASDEDEPCGTAMVIS